ESDARQETALISKTCVWDSCGRVPICPFKSGCFLQSPAEIPDDFSSLPCFELTRSFRPSTAIARKQPVERRTADSRKGTSLRLPRPRTSPHALTNKRYEDIELRARIRIAPKSWRRIVGSFAPTSEKHVRLTVDAGRGRCRWRGPGVAVIAPC